MQLKPLSTFPARTSTTVTGVRRTTKLNILRDALSEMLDQWEPPVAIEDCRFLLRGGKLIYGDTFRDMCDDPREAGSFFDFSDGRGYVPLFDFSERKHTLYIVLKLWGD